MRRPFDRAKAQTVNRGVFFEGIVSGIGGLIPGLTPPNDKGLKMHKNRPTISGLPKSTTPNFFRLRSCFYIGIREQTLNITLQYIIRTCGPA